MHGGISKGIYFFIPSKCKVNMDKSKCYLLAKIVKIKLHYNIGGK